MPFKILEKTPLILLVKSVFLFLFHFLHRSFKFIVLFCSETINRVQGMVQRMLTTVVVDVPLFLLKELQVSSEELDSYLTRLSGKGKLARFLGSNRYQLFLW